MENHDDVRAEVAALREEMQELKSSVKDLVDAWRTASGVVRFVKWLASVATAFGVIVALLKGVHFGDVK